MAYAFESKVVESAIADLQSTFGNEIKIDLDRERSAAATSLEFYGLTKTFFERYLPEHRTTGLLRASVVDAIRAIEVMYGSRSALIFRCTAFPQHLLRRIKRWKERNYVERS